MNPAASSLRVAGLVRLSTCDWPGQLAATVFCQGCAWNCPYCHNAALRPTEGGERIPWPAILDFLKTRQGLLDAVVFSGGEPTLQPALPAAMEAVKRLGFRIGLHTAGPVADRLAPLFPLLDWVGFDVKAPFADYTRITGVEGSGDQALASLRLLVASGVAFEARTTAPSALLRSADLIAMESELVALGVRRYVLQRFRAEGVRPGPLLEPPDLSLPPLPPGFGQRFAAFEIR